MRYPALPVTAPVKAVERPKRERPFWSGISNAAYYGALAFFGAVALIGLVFVKSRYSLTSGNILLFCYTYFITAFELSRLGAAVVYERRMSSAMSARPKMRSLYEPYVTFVIPCKNEEGAIIKTVTKCFDADYPMEKIEVIVINDGSTDRTFEKLKSLAGTYNTVIIDDGGDAFSYGFREGHNKLVIVDWKVNRGKRHGMAEGFKRASGEIIIQLDSDSYIDPPTFRELVAPFENPEIGAVCAHADPENADHNLLTRMQAAYYFMSFRILKAAESTFFTVFCCSGCSSAYRKSVVLPIIDVWQNETFLGKPITWGDDRALTNWVLRLDYHTIYTDKARAFTIVPTRLRQFLKQQVRWKKGWFVNSIFVAGFILKKRPFIALTYFYPLILVTLLTPFMAARAMIYGPLVKGMVPQYYILGIFLMASVITLYYRAVARTNRYWPYIFLWAGLNTILLSYILFYALLRLNDRKWGTR